jgi:hypothetical protein
MFQLSSYNYKKVEISINPLNYTATEKIHATEELLGNRGKTPKTYAAV